MAQDPLQSIQSNTKRTVKNENESITTDTLKVLPLLPLFRSKSLKNDNILLQSMNKSLQSLDSKPSFIKRNVSDGIALSNASLQETYHVRTCRVEDSEYIFKLLHQTWPEYGDWRNTKYWTKQFLQNNEIYGFVIEQIIVTDAIKMDIDKEESKTDDININKTENIDKNKTDNNAKRIVGIALYQWNSPGPKQNWAWRETDFPTNVQSDFNNPKFEKAEYQKIIDKEKEEQKQKIKTNVNLDKHFSKIHTHFVHFTDIAIDPTFRGKGLGTQLVQTIIYSFPKDTKFGLEVETTNIGAVKCYTKCGFQIVRLVENYYGKDRDSYKMTLVSDYIDEDIDEFFEKCVLKHKQIRLKSLKNSIEKLSKQKSAKQNMNDNENKETKIDDIFVPPSLAMNNNNNNNNDSTDSVEVVNKYLNMDDEDAMFMENILIQLGLSAFKEDFQDYGINKSNLMTLSTDILPYVIPIEELRVKFEKWLINYQQNNTQ